MQGSGIPLANYEFCVRSCRNEHLNIQLVNPGIIDNFNKGILTETPARVKKGSAVCLTKLE